MAALRFATNSYFLDGSWDADLASGLEPILIDPKWEHTSLAKTLNPLLDAQLIPYEDLNPSVENNKGRFWIATSGSTGQIKLIQKNYSQILAEAEFWKGSFQETLGWSWTDERFLVTVPLCHLYGLIWGYVLPRLLGAKIHCLRPSEATTDDFLPSDFLIAIPFFLAEWHRHAFPLPKRILTSGSKFPVPLAQEFRKVGKVDIREIYGSSETGAIGVRNPMWKARFTLLPMVEAKVEEHGSELTLAVKSQFVSTHSLEYVPNETQMSTWNPNSLINKDGFFLTSDCGELSELGWNHFGRIDRIAKIKGKRISLDLVESLILANTKASDVAVVNFMHAYDFEIGCLVVLDIEIEDFAEALKVHLPSSHIPKKIFLAKSIPKLPNGKTNYQEVTEKLKDDLIA
jgi:acyl-coenzyme A synthetase/AMP-(fatty) acid ligase